MLAVLAEFSALFERVLSISSSNNAENFETLDMQGNFGDAYFWVQWMSSAQLPMVTQAIDEMLAKLEPLREAGIICRASANTPGATGHVLRNGQILIWYAGDTEFTALSGMSTQQSYRSTFALLGRLQGIKSAVGVEAVRDALYQLLAGLVLSGYREPLRVESFTVGQRQTDHQPFEMTVSAPAVLSWCIDDGGELEGVVEGADAVEVLLKVIDVEAETESGEIEFGRVSF